MNKENEMRHRKRQVPSFPLKSKDRKRRRVSFATSTTVHEFDSSIPLKTVNPTKAKQPRRSSLKNPLRKKKSPKKIVFQEVLDEDEDDDMRLTVSHPNEMENQNDDSFVKPINSHSINESTKTSQNQEKKESTDRNQNSQPRDSENFSFSIGRNPSISRSSDMKNTVMLPLRHSTLKNLDDVGEDRRESDMRLTLTNEYDIIQPKTPSPKTTRYMSVVQGNQRPSTVILDDLNANEEDNTETMTPQIQRITKRLSGRSPALQRAIRTTSLPVSFGINFVKQDPSIAQSLFTTDEFIKKLGIPDLGGLEIFRSSTGRRKQKHHEKMEDEEEEEEEENEDEENDFNSKSLHQKTTSLINIFLNQPEKEVYEKHLQNLSLQTKKALLEKQQKTLQYNQNNPSSFLTLHSIIHSKDRMIQQNRRMTSTKEARKNRFFRFMKRAKNQVTAKSRLQSLHQESELYDELIVKGKKSIDVLEDDFDKLKVEQENVRREIEDIKKEFDDLNQVKTDEILELEQAIAKMKLTHQQNNVSEKRNRDLSNEVIFYQKTFMQCKWKTDPKTGRFLLIFDQVGLTFEIDVQFYNKVKSSNNEQITKEVVKMIYKKSHCNVHDGNEKIREKLIESCQFQTKICDHVHNFSQLRTSMIEIHQKINSIIHLCRILYLEIFRKRNIFYTFVDNNDLMRKLAGLEIKNKQQKEDNNKEIMFLVPLEISIRTKKCSFRIFLPVDCNYPKTNFEKFGIFITRGKVLRSDVLKIIRKVPDDTIMRIPKICDAFKELDDDIN